MQIDVNMTLQRDIVSRKPRKCSPWSVPRSSALHRGALSSEAMLRKQSMGNCCWHWSSMSLVVTPETGLELGALRMGPSSATYIQARAISPSQPGPVLAILGHLCFVGVTFQPTLDLTRMALNLKFVAFQ